MESDGLQVFYYIKNLVNLKAAGSSAGYHGRSDISLYFDIEKIMNVDPSLTL